ncbi:hypothetical protein [Microcoleus sp. B5-D4]|uniref:hypothetical protein n=1 Tax=Microcoleus sp. B5-D4 TaxID=2818681 RepID=UPI002FD0FD0C
MPVPQENSLFVEQAGKPVLENGARCEIQPNFVGRVHQQYLIPANNLYKPAPTQQISLCIQRGTFRFAAQVGAGLRNYWY